jgi:hypothetical protein
MEIYGPQWDENDVPRVGCPHIKGQRIGSDFCHKQCQHLDAIMDEPYRERIRCAYPENGARKTEKIGYRTAGA